MKKLIPAFIRVSKLGALVTGNSVAYQIINQSQQKIDNLFKMQRAGAGGTGEMHEITMPVHMRAEFERMKDAFEGWRSEDWIIPREVASFIEAQLRQFGAAGDDSLRYRCISNAYEMAFFYQKRESKGGCVTDEHCRYRPRNAKTHAKGEPRQVRAAQKDRRRPQALSPRQHKWQRGDASPEQNETRIHNQVENLVRKVGGKDEKRPEELNHRNSRSLNESEIMKGLGNVLKKLDDAERMEEAERQLLAVMKNLDDSESVSK